MCEPQTFVMFFPEGFYHLDPVDRLRQVGRNFRHHFAQFLFLRPHPDPEVSEVQRLQKNDDQRQHKEIRVHDEKCNHNADNGKEVDHHIGKHGGDHAVQTRHIRQNIGDEFPRAVFLIEAQGKVLQVLEKFDPHPEECPVPRVIKEEVAHIEEDLPETVCHDDPQEQQDHEAPVIQTAVNNDLQKPR